MKMLMMMMIMKNIFLVHMPSIHYHTHTQAISQSCDLSTPCRPFSPFAYTKTGSLICCEVFAQFPKQSSHIKQTVEDNRHFEDRIHNLCFAAYWSQYIYEKCILISQMTSLQFFGKEKECNKIYVFCSLAFL